MLPLTNFDSSIVYLFSQKCFLDIVGKIGHVSWWLLRGNVKLKNQKQFDRLGDCNIVYGYTQQVCYICEGVTKSAS